MRSCSERTTLHCVESYLYYIILVNKKNDRYNIRTLSENIQFISTRCETGKKNSSILVYINFIFSTMYR
jgi:hypothetical protein